MTGVAARQAWLVSDGAYSVYRVIAVHADEGRAYEHAAELAGLPVDEVREYLTEGRYRRLDYRIDVAVTPISYYPQGGHHIMDPNECMARMIRWAMEGNVDELRDAADDLVGWLRKGGAPPTEEGLVRAVRYAADVVRGDR